MVLGRVRLECRRMYNTIIMRVRRECRAIKVGSW